MSDLIIEVQDKVCTLSLNRIDKCNAFDDKLLGQLQTQVDRALADPKVRVIVLKAEGSYFSAGADLEWMQRMAQYTFEENIKDAQILANLMHSLYHSEKPTIAMVQGAAFGGGVGLVAACDVAFASFEARFCFSEVRLGLIPAVISPFVLKAIGSRSATALFMSAEEFDAKTALELGLVYRCFLPETLQTETLKYAKAMAKLAPQAVQDCKKLVREVENKALDQNISHYTAQLIAEKRVSVEGQKGLTAFLNKKKPNWD